MKTLFDMLKDPVDIKPGVFNPMKGNGRNRASAEFQRLADIIFSDEITQLYKSKEIRVKILKKNLMAAMFHSGNRPEQWSDGEFSRFFSSSSETRTGNFTNDFICWLILQIDPDAKVGNEKKYLDAEFYHRRLECRVHLQIKSSKRHGNSTSTPALEREMANSITGMKATIAVLGITDVKSKKKHCRGIDTIAGDAFWYWLLGVDNFQRDFLIPELEKAIERNEDGLDRARKFCRDTILRHARRFMKPNGRLDLVKLYQLED